MTITLVWAGCILVGALLWKNAANYRVDAAPVGSMMLAAAIGLWVAAIFIFGIQVGMLVS